MKLFYTHHMVSSSSSYNMLSKVESRLIRYYSMSLDDHLQFCSKDSLSSYIWSTYTENADIFPESWTFEKVRDIQSRIVEGTYTLSPCLIRSFPLNADLGHTHKIYVKEHPDIYMSVNPTEEDRLVLMALGRMLCHFFFKENIFMDNSFGLRISVPEFYSNLCARGNVLRLYKFDLTRSMRTINRKILLCKLEHMVQDLATIELVSQFLYIPIKDESGIDLTAEMGLSIPSSDLITYVLLNFALIEFDEEFQRVFPELDYSRYLHEVFVSFPKTSSKTFVDFERFEELVLSFFDKLYLDGKILSIVPGEGPVPCYGSLVCVSQEGEIKEEKKL